MKERFTAIWYPTQHCRVYWFFMLTAHSLSTLKGRCCCHLCGVKAQGGEVKAAIKGTQEGCKGQRVGNLEGRRCCHLDDALQSSIHCCWCPLQ